MVQPIPTRRKLPATRQALNHKFVVDGYEGYLTVGLYEDGTPGEIFGRISKMGSTINGLLDACCIAISLGLQHGVPLETLCNKFEHMKFEPHGMTANSEIPHVSSPVDYLAKWLRRQFLDTTKLTVLQTNGHDNGLQQLVDREIVASHGMPSGLIAPVPALVRSGNSCPDCGAVLFYEEGCMKCTSCLYCKCG